MKLHRAIPFFLFITLFACAGTRHGQAPSTPASELDSDEIAVMAVVLDAAYAHATPGWVMVATRTATFKCNPPSNIGLDVGGCDGMRDVTETAEERLAKVRKEIPGVPTDSVADLIRKSQESTILPGPLPVPVKQVMHSPDKRTDWKFGRNPSFAAYFSRVGFDSVRARALIYLGTISWTDQSKSMGQYLYLEKQEGAWTIKDHVRVWELITAPRT